MKRRSIALIAGAVASALTVAALEAPASAKVDIYAVDGAVTAAPGTVLKQAQGNYPAGILGISTYDATVTSVQYASTGPNSEKTAVTGTIIVPNKAWTGRGERPIIAYAPGTQGMADNCAPSKQLAAGTLYDGAFIKSFFDAGYAVAMTDYQGLGTPGEHPYAINDALGANTLDVVRAAIHLGYSSTAPVYVAGFSEGGGAAASALETHRTYAPELNIQAGYVGAPTADLSAIGSNLEGGMYETFMLFAVKMLYDTYPDVHAAVDEITNDAGKSILTDQYIDSIGCLPNNLVPSWFMETTTLTKDGSTITSHLTQEPFKSRLDSLELGYSKIDVPTLIGSSWGDDVIPYESVKSAARNYCTLGSNIRFETKVAPTHVASGYEMGWQMAGFFNDRTNKRWWTSNCGWF